MKKIKKYTSGILGFFRTHSLISLQLILTIYETKFVYNIVINNYGIIIIQLHIALTHMK